MLLELEIQGMHCEGCKRALEQALNDCPNVINAKVSLENSTALVKVKENTKVKLLEKIVKNTGFKCLSIKEVLNEKDSFKY